jgi:two-component system, NarL family, response regulator NreC
VPKCILIVDDFEPIRRAVRTLFESESGFDVCGEAVDGYDAIQKAQELKPDLIIIDLSMPRMSGIEAAPILKKMLPQTPIVLLTSHQRALQGYDAYAVGIDLVVPKGGDISLLLNSVQELLQEAEADWPLAAQSRWQSSSILRSEQPPSLNRDTSGIKTPALAVRGRCKKG